MIITWLYVGAAILFLMVLIWLNSVRLKNASIVDIFWGLLFVLAAWVIFFLSPDGFIPRKLLVAGTVSIWGIRLAWHIFQRNHSKPEDFRYAAWRQQYGSSWWWRSFYRVFLIQGVLAWIICLPLIPAITAGYPQNFVFLDFVGAFIWLVGFIFEAGGDYQLARFKANPDNKGKLLNQGLWKYTRHPNYFGDAVQWWGWFIIAVGTGGSWTIIGPIIMTFLLVKVSGVALLERTLAVEKPGYREYIEKTNSFFPWFPKK
jgi:steroid 5-alpha reductase family enzyme